MSLGAYKKGSDRRLDDALGRIDAIEAFLRQDRKEHSPFDTTIEELAKVVR